MQRIHPGMFFVLITLLLYVCSLTGSWLRERYAEHAERHSSTFKTLEGSVLALLALLLGFTFSMAIARFNERKQAEVAEANAITATWLRTATLPEPARSQEQQLLRLYMPVRLEFLASGTSTRRLTSSLEKAGDLQAQMWGVAAGVAATHPDPVLALYLTSLSEAVGAVEVRTAAYENRIPGTAWALLLFIAAISSTLVGVGISSRSRLLRSVLPLVVAAALAQTLDLDSPRSGFIRLRQHSMDRAAQRLMGPAPEPAGPAHKEQCF